MNECRKPKMDRSHIYLMQILFVAGITFGSQSLDLNNKHKWIYSIARFIVYILTVEISKVISLIIYDVIQNQKSLDARLLAKVNRHQVAIFIVSLAVLYLNDQRLYNEDFSLIFIAYLIVKYPVVENKTGVTVTYGTGMACSFIEGYLNNIIPSNGADFVGFLENIRTYEAAQGIVFPVKRMFIIITKSLFCPPDLKEFNDKSGREDIARIEACQAVAQCAVVRDVAGVKARRYHNTAYKLSRPRRRPVYVAAECATPLHTLYKVVKNRDLYEELADVNVNEIISDFVSMLQTCLPKSPELRNKCELVYFDDTDPTLNLADVLLDKIKELEPNFEELVNRSN